MSNSTLEYATPLASPARGWLPLLGVTLVTLAANLVMLVVTARYSSIVGGVWVAVAVAWIFSPLFNLAIVACSVAMIPRMRRRLARRWGLLYMLAAIILPVTGILVNIGSLLLLDFDGS